MIFVLKKSEARIPQPSLFSGLEQGNYSSFLANKLVFISDFAKEMKMKIIVEAVDYSHWSGRGGDTYTQKEDA